VSRYASVYPLVTTRALARPFTYEAPDDVERGAVVLVRLGGAKQRGVVIGLEDAPPEGVEAVPIERVEESLPPALVELALWLADYYGSTPGRALALVAPPRRRRRKELRRNAPSSGFARRSGQAVTSCSTAQPEAGRRRCICRRPPALSSAGSE
jgi:primosomal protein N'